MINVRIIKKVNKHVLNDKLNSILKMVFVWLFYHFLSACSNERWGDGCSNECNCEDEEEQCHYRNGGCDDSGCKAGSKGDGCDECKSITPSRDHEVCLWLKSSYTVVIIFWSGTLVYRINIVSLYHAYANQMFKVVLLITS